MTGGAGARARRQAGQRLPGRLRHWIAVDRDLERPPRRRSIPARKRQRCVK